MKFLPLLLISFVFITSACTPVQAQNINGKVDLSSSQWELVSFGKMDAEVPVIEGTTITLIFDDDGMVSGSSGCNTYSGVYTIQNEIITFGEIVSTLMACADQAFNDQEAQFLQALGTASKLTVTDDNLTIWHDNESRVLNFVRAATSTPAAPTDTPAAAQPAERMDLAPGADPVLSISLLPSGFGVVQYVLAVSAGQTLAIELTSDDVPLSLTIRTPSGVERFPETSPVEGGGYLISHTLMIDDAGDYIVTLTKADHTPSTQYTVSFTVK